LYTYLDSESRLKRKLAFELASENDYNTNIPKHVAEFLKKPSAPNQI